jgi:hypothetical protein
MPREQWTLQRGRPCVGVVLTLAADGRSIERNLLADAGAGALPAGFELILDEDDCLLCGGNPTHAILLSGAYTGSYPRYVLRVRLPSVGFDEDVTAVAVPRPPTGFDGIAGFGFLNRFTYGNFGDPTQFGLEC